MAKFLCDIGSLLVGIITGACFCKYGRALSDRLAELYNKNKEPINWEKECGDCGDDCDDDCDCELTADF